MYAIRPILEHVLNLALPMVLAFGTWSPDSEISSKRQNEGRRQLGSWGAVREGVRGKVNLALSDRLLRRDACRYQQCTFLGERCR